MFLTGHTGFKGSWLSLWLQSLGAEVCGFSLPAPTRPSLFELANIAEGMTSIMGDIRDANNLTQTLQTYQPDIVIHMAAQSLVRESYLDPAGTYATNVMGTLHLLEAARQIPSVKVVVNVTTDKCYENREWTWGYRENDRLGGHDPYASSKACAEILSASYRQSFLTRQGIAMATVRAGNVIGGGDWATDRLIPDIMRGFLANEPVQIRYPDAVRPWQHVLEPLHGYLMLAERLWVDGEHYAEGWNFGPAHEDAKPVRWIANTLASHWNTIHETGANWYTDTDSHPHETGTLRLDCAKARERLGWIPQLPLETALHWIVEWYGAYAANQDMRQRTLDHIARYTSQFVIEEAATAVPS